MIAVLDLGINNLSSVQSGFRRVGAKTAVIGQQGEWTKLRATATVHGVVLPGVGAFAKAMGQLQASGLRQVVDEAVARAIPLLGICLGMQVLFDASEEHGEHQGLGLLPGRVVRFKAGAKVPHIGWNSLAVMAAHPLLQGIRDADMVYFVHSYYALLQQQEHLLAGTEYSGVVVPAVIGNGRVYGTQFHPEKSGPVGERILRNFARLCGAVEMDGDGA